MAIREIILMNGEKRYEAYFKLENVRYQKRFPSKKEAKNWEVDEKRRLKDMSQSLMYSQACDEYLKFCKQKIATNTWNEKYHHLREFAEFMRIDFPLEQVTLKDARLFLASIQNTKCNKSANRRLRTMKALWNWHKMTPANNPWREAEQFPEEEFVKYIPPEHDIKTVLDIAEKWEKDILLLLLHTGARISEILNLKWTDVANDHIRLWTKKRKNGSRQHRTIPIGHCVKDLLKQHKTDNPNSEYVLINPLTKESYKKGQPAIKFMLRRLCCSASDLI